MTLLIDFDIDPSAAVGVLDGYGRRASDMRPAMTLVRGLLIEGHQRNVESEGAFLGSNWAPLSPETLRRKRREGLSPEPLRSSGSLLQALMGGRGRSTSVTRTATRVGVKKGLFWTVFHMAGARGTRRGEMPARPVIGINEAEGETAVSLLHRFLDHG